MSVLQSLSDPEERLAHIRSLMTDPAWQPPSYLFVDATLRDVRLVNWCTVLDDEDAIALFEDTPGAIYIQKKGDDGKYRMLPVKYDEELNKVVPLAA